MASSYAGAFRAGAPKRGPDPTATFPDDEANRAEDRKILLERAKADQANQNPARTSKPRLVKNQEPAPTPSRRARLRGGAKRAANQPISLGQKGPRKVSFRNPTGGRSVVGVGHSAAGLALGAILYALVISVVKYGASGPKLWFDAKFLNEAAGASSSSSTPNYTTPAPGGGSTTTQGASPWAPANAPNSVTPLPKNVPGTIF